MKAYKEYLDELGVQSCTHSAKEKKLFISVSASCNFSIPSGPTPMTKIMELWEEWEMDGKLLKINTSNLST